MTVAPRVDVRKGRDAGRGSTRRTKGRFQRVRQAQNARWEHESVLDALQRRLDRKLDAMTVQRQTVEHVFGTFRQSMGYKHFQPEPLPPAGLIECTKRPGTVELSIAVVHADLGRDSLMTGVAGKTRYPLRNGGSIG